VLFYFITKITLYGSFWKVRVPTGKIVLELPAGMLDDDKGDFVGTAVREVLDNFVKEFECLR